MKHVYSFDFNFLDNLDTPEKAYFLGWAYSDGYNNGKGTYKLSIQENDEEILYKFKEILQSSYPIGKKWLTLKNPNWKNQSIFYVHNKHFSASLSRLNVVPKKSSILSISPEIPDELMSYFLRGVFEGDGHFSFKKIKNGQIRAVFQITTGSQTFANQLRAVIFKLTNEEISIYENGGNFWVKFSTTRKAYRFLKWLYKDRTDLSLSRKYNKIIEFLEIFQPLYEQGKERVGGVKTDESKLINLEEMRLSGKTLSQISKEIGVHEGVVFKWAKRNKNICNIKMWKKYTSNESFFDFLGPVQCFILGLIYGKGSITNNFNLKITSSHLNIEFLEEIREIMGSTRPIYNLKGKNQLSIASKKLYNTLISLGIRPIKSDCVPPILDENQLKHFILGFIIANTKVFKKSKRQWFRVSIAVNNVLIEPLLRATLENVLGCELRTSSPNKKSLFFNFAKKQQVKKLFQYLLEELPIKNFDYWKVDLADMMN